MPRPIRTRTDEEWATMIQGFEGIRLPK
ncbi:hypothetical protein VSWAT3_16335 [Vibrionales bacterium SWAT-3]|nr:hypothetical protein VSWAT3_16335 [Vibrionales bacterium SWAT-3]